MCYSKEEATTVELAKEGIQPLSSTIDAFETFSPATPSHGFPLFSQLPTELRLEIWRLALYAPLVNIKNVPDHEPAVLQACRESRSVTHSQFYWFLEMWDYAEGLYEFEGWRPVNPEALLREYFER